MKRRTQCQLTLQMPEQKGHGGKRRNAGRPPTGERPGVRHRPRPEMASRFPVHITLKVKDHVWNLRSRRSLCVIEHAFRGAQRDGFRIVHFSVQGNHLHVIAEAWGTDALCSGAKALSVRLALGLNRMMGRRGPVLADRYHSHVLCTPAETRRALAYVLLNHRSHLARIGEAVGAGLDAFSSAANLRRMDHQREGCCEHAEARPCAARENRGRPTRADALGRYSGSANMAPRDGMAAAGADLGRRDPGRALAGLGPA
jgi:REP element-mobilizing transposase RayT